MKSGTISGTLVQAFHAERLRYETPQTRMNTGPNAERPTERGRNVPAERSTPLLGVERPERRNDLGVVDTLSCACLSLKRLPLRGQPSRTNPGGSTVRQTPCQHERLTAMQSPSASPSTTTEVNAMLEPLRAMWRRISPHHRRALHKRRLEAVMREHGIPRRLAAQITNHYFRKDDHA